MYLGRRTVVTNASLAQAPVGTVVTSTAQLSVQVADRAPVVERRCPCRKPVAAVACPGESWARE
ncbi:hypothetical protein GCM10009727_52360 [Actinomadura napierensis]|uniref:Uncharacterized protein n=1 Tax=Actinomadura napierensis TaxID=267854 RepID=A0ABN2ZWL6_9ACTN